MRRLIALLERLACHDAPVLVVGESGTGKELVARSLHTEGDRADGPFDVLNCAAIPDNLAESALFGHEPGAFTGATNRRDGAFQRADGGTLFLDEVGELSLAAQAKLLRVLETGDVRRVGGAKVEHPDVRVIAATHRDLRSLVQQGAFREDLYFRLAVLTAVLPPLRDRLGDLEVLCDALLSGRHPHARLHPDALQRLQHHGWPGNVRELRNVLTRAVVLHGDHIYPEHLQFDPFAFTAVVGRPGDDGEEAEERRRIEQAMLQTQGNRAAAARMLGIPRTSLIYRLRKFGLEEVAGSP